MKKTLFYKNKKQIEALVAYAHAVFDTINVSGVESLKKSNVYAEFVVRHKDFQNVLTELTVQKLEDAKEDPKETLKKAYDAFTSGVSDCGYSKSEAVRSQSAVISKLLSLNRIIWYKFKDDEVIASCSNILNNLLLPANATAIKECNLAERYADLKEAFAAFSLLRIEGKNDRIDLLGNQKPGTVKPLLLKSISDLLSFVRISAIETKDPLWQKLDIQLVDRRKDYRGTLAVLSSAAATEDSSTTTSTEDASNASNASNVSAGSASSNPTPQPDNTPKVAS